jgi:hypothetical protein
MRSSWNNVLERSLLMQRSASIGWKGTERLALHVFCLGVGDYALGWQD